MCVIYKILVILKGRIAGCSLSCGSKRIPWVVARDKVKHVAFLKLWLRMTSLELWLEMADEHEELLSCGSGWRVLPV